VGPVYRKWKAPEKPAWRLKRTGPLFSPYLPPRDGFVAQIRIRDSLLESSMIAFEQVLSEEIDLRRAGGMLSVRG